MSEVKHTPGPWVTEIHGSNKIQVIRTDEDEPWFLFEATFGAPDVKANAHLIAAAPDMYEAGGALIADVMRRYDLKSIHELHCPYMRALAHALAKARGEQ